MTLMTGSQNSVASCPARDNPDVKVFRNFLPADDEANEMEASDEDVHHADDMQVDGVLSPRGSRCTPGSHMNGLLPGQCCTLPPPRPYLIPCSLLLVH